METVRYSQGRLLAAALLGGGLAAFFCWSLANPLRFGPGFFIGRIIAGPFGQIVLAPLIIVTGILMFWRALATLAGDRVAVAFTEREIQVNTMWRRASIAWSDLRSAEVERVRFRWFSSRTLVFRTDLGKYRLPVALTDLSNTGVAKLLTALDRAAETRTRPGAGPVSLSKGAARQPVEEGGSFDADAAIARYLARKASAPDQTTGPSGAQAATSSARAELPAAPLRPAFGRKGVHG